MGWGGKKFGLKVEHAKDVRDGSSFIVIIIFFKLTKCSKLSVEGDVQPVECGSFCVKHKHILW